MVSRKLSGGCLNTVEYMLRDPWPVYQLLTAYNNDRLGRWLFRSFRRLKVEDVPPAL